MATKKTAGQLRYARDKERRALREFLADAELLNHVITLPACCRMYNINRHSVLVAINTGALVARKDEVSEGNKGGAWLILKASAEKLWKARKQ